MRSEQSEERKYSRIGTGTTLMNASQNIVTHALSRDVLLVVADRTLDPQSRFSNGAPSLNALTDEKNK